MSCEKATEIIEKGKVVTLNFKEVLSLKIHLMMCSPCANYNRLSNQIDEILKESLTSNTNEIKLSEAKKQSILNAVNNLKLS